jgi:hypothetical protein
MVGFVGAAAALGLVVMSYFSAGREKQNTKKEKEKIQDVQTH